MSNYRAEFFADVFHNRQWASLESASGYGSDTLYTRELVAALPDMLNRLSVVSMLDVPCGDFHWMKDVDLRGISYTGGDIVPAMIEANRALYARPGVAFETIDLVSDDLPKVDMIFVRDCFIHFTNDLIRKSLHNIQRSGSRYLCVSHEANINRFGGPNGHNIDLDRAVEGVNYEFRPVSFELQPFAFGKPLDSVVDRIDGDSVTLMAVWDIAALPLN